MDEYMIEFYAYLRAARWWRDRGQFPTHDPCIPVKLEAKYRTRK